MKLDANFKVIKSGLWSMYIKIKGMYMEEKERGI